MIPKSVAANWFDMRQKIGYCISTRRVRDVFKEISDLKLEPYKNVWLRGEMFGGEAYLIVLINKTIEVWRIF